MILVEDPSTRSFVVAYSPRPPTARHHGQVGKGSLAKLFAADTWIVLDDVQFTRRDYQHRTRLVAPGDPQASRWMSIPTHLPQGRQTLIRDALIVDPDLALRRSTAMLQQYYGASPHWPTLAQALEPMAAAFGSSRTAAVAETSTRILLDLLGWKGQILRSSDLRSRQGRSQRLADLTTAVGARSYLCGTGGMKYLDMAPFMTQGIAITPFLTPPAGVWASGHRITVMWALATLGPTAVAGRLQAVAAAQTALATTA